MTHKVVFLYYVLSGLNINVGQVIANEIKQCAHAASNKSPLGHPSLITHFCELVGVNTSTLPFERPKKEIDDSYYTQYCMLNEEELLASGPQPPRVHRRPPQAAQQDQAQDDDFMAHVAWPTNQAQVSGGAGASGATAMEEDGDDEDEDEDEEEEEDEEDEDDDEEFDDSRG
ncbi:hypothetical protein LR48_Vigan853s000700 [Vigna angularis]|uniref:Putative plant transposon protein domain-containing protein n=1 Tax=Phaseolus angularis TaxID=3914 RepID=A0A0L9TIW7_PHAAN|nr:hypothetical protein LR48_Vigan853s000700 [Vigna angularis]